MKLGLSLLVEQTRLVEGVKEADRAVALDPLSPYTNTEFGHALLLAGRYQESVEQFRKSIVLAPGRNKPYNFMGRALYLQGKTAEAISALDDSVKKGVLVDGPAWPGPGWLACADERAGRHDEAVTVLQHGLADTTAARLLAQTYACLGDEQHTLDYLEKALAQHEPGVAEILQAPELQWLRAHRRFALLRQRVNLPS